MEERKSFLDLKESEPNQYKIWLKDEVTQSLLEHIKYHKDLCADEILNSDPLNPELGILVRMYKDYTILIDLLE